MNHYIGTKAVNATPMTRAAYNTMRGWTLPADENGDDAGYLVEYTDGGKPNHPGFAGYISWSPKEQFDKAYRPTTALTFGLALEAMKNGGRITRGGWNGKGMWLSMSGPLEGRTISHDKFWSPHNAAFAYNQPNSEAKVLPCITMKTVHDEILMGWTATTTDLLAEDWMVWP